MKGQWWRTKGGAAGAAFESVAGGGGGEGGASAIENSQTMIKSTQSECAFDYYYALVSEKKFPAF